MSQILTDQDFAKTKRNIDDIDKAVNTESIVDPLWGGDFKSLPMVSKEWDAKTQDAQSTINLWQEAITQITVNDGVPALAVSTANGSNQQAVNDLGGVDYWAARAYQTNNEVRLDDGTVVISTMDNNNNNPNSNMTGWKKKQAADQIFDESGKTQQEINNSTPRFFKSLNELLSFKPKNNGQLVALFAYHEDSQYGGSDFIAIQSTILVENGVTVFRSKVVGYEDYFWVRVNISYITPEMAGAKGDKVNNDRDAWQKCLNLGGNILARDGASYLIYGDDITTHVDTSILVCEKPCFIESKNKSSIYFKHDVTTGSPISLTVRGTTANLDGFKLEGFNIFGHVDRGASNVISRAWGVTFRGVDNLTIKNCKFSTFQGRPFTVNRRANVDWIQSTNLDNANTKEAVMRLLDLSSKNVVIENIYEEYFASAGFAIFGGNGVFVNGVTGDTSEASFKYLAWTDDASSQTKLSDYAVNNNIHFKNINGVGEVVLDSTANGSISNCNVTKIGYRSYDFDQQKNNFDVGTHVYNPDDHLTLPFMWMKFFNRQISIHDNTCENIVVRGIYSNIHDNYVHTSADSQSLIVFTGNGISWGGVNYFDSDETVNFGVKNSAVNNTFVVKHLNCIGVDYGSVSPTSRINAIDNIVELTRDALNFTVLRPFNQTYRRESHYLTSLNNGVTLSKRINHHVDVRQSMLTQGVGYNHYKSFVNIFGGQAVQSIANFTNTTTSVEFFIVLFDTSGLMCRKKVSVSSANAATVTDMDSQTSYNASFTVTVTGSNISLNFTPTARDITLDITGIGVNGNCVFLSPSVRATTTGG